MKLNSRAVNFLLFFSCHELLVAAYYFQYVDGMEPCPLCIFQRLFIAALAVTFLVHCIHNHLHRIYNGLAVFFALGGLFFSGRHVYLQSLPADNIPSCGPGLNYLIDTFPAMEVLKRVLYGSGQCAENNWQLLGLSMPMWVLLAFSGFLILAIWRWLRPGNAG